MTMTVTLTSFTKVDHSSTKSLARASPQLSFGIDVVKVQKLCDITKPWLEKVGALCKKRGCAYFDTPSFCFKTYLPSVIAYIENTFFPSK